MFGEQNKFKELFDKFGWELIDYQSPSVWWIVFGVPEDLAKSFSVLLPIGEIFIAILLLFVQTSWFGAIGRFLLLLIFIGGMIFQMTKGNAPGCHCFRQIHSEPVSAKSLIRKAAIGAPQIWALLGKRK